MFVLSTKLIALSFALLADDSSCCFAISAAVDAFYAADSTYAAGN